jgi:translation initiation factor IF-3
MNEDRVVKCFDENDTRLGEMTLREAQLAAKSANKDLVLRNEKIDPPVVKMMNYKKELLKRLFKKMGNET